MHDEAWHRNNMKVDMNKLGCKTCKYRNGNVCNICWKKVYKELEERKDVNSAKTHKRDTKENKDN